jgi:hypothetical protein
VLGHGLPSFESPARRSNRYRCPVRPKGPTPPEITNSPTPTSDETIEIAVGVPGNIHKINVRRGITVSDALEAVGIELPREEGWSLRLSPLGKLVPNGGHRVDLRETINERSALLLFQPIRGRARINRLPHSSKEYWSRFGSDLLANVVVGKYLFIALMGFWLVSSVILFTIEASTILHALYTTWTTMLTIGPLNGAPVTFFGKLLISADAFVGLIFFGSIVWLVTFSLLREE